MPQLAQDHPADQKARDDEEDIDTQIALWENVLERVVKNYRGDGDAA